MTTFDEILKDMTFDFFGSGEHKIEMESLFSNKDGMLLDIRSKEEHESLEIKLQHHIPVLWIPIDEIPDRYAEIPQNKTIGVFCAAGTRSAIVYAYLLTKGFERVRIAPSTYDALTKLLMPGKLYKSISARRVAQSKE